MNTVIEELEISGLKEVEERAKNIKGLAQKLQDEIRLINEIDFKVVQRLPESV